MKLSVFRSGRRQVLASAIGLPLLAQTQGKPLVFPGKDSMLVHNDFPEDLEAPPGSLDSFLTPVERFFVRQHLPRPRVDEGQWRLAVRGMVSRPSALTLDELSKLAQHKLPATLECAGNGRGYFHPRVPGLQWTKGAVSTAEWAGPRLADILERAGLDAKATYASFDGADVGAGQTPDFVRSIPMRKCLHPDTILALTMNGKPIPPIHGFPARLIVPGWDGASWVKWVTSITAVPEADKGFFFATAYKYPKRPVAPGGAAKPEEMETIEAMPVKSVFTRPGAGTPASPAKFRLERTTLSGLAWSGENRIVRVEVSADGGSRWLDATLGKEDYRYAWRLWHHEWTPPGAGYYTLCVRATDSAGRTQPIEAAWNPSGYLWNSIERIGALVEA
ncbi:MAG: sulfite oxidase [Bryobacterales bacterium]|nr:sulfite oxidase [Bryobacterales bacterium]